MKTRRKGFIWYTFGMVSLEKENKSFLPAKNIEGIDDPLVLTHFAYGYATLKDKDGKSWRWTYHNNEWISEDVDDPDLVAPMGEVEIVSDKKSFKNKEEAAIYLAILTIKRDVETGIQLHANDSKDSSGNMPEIYKSYENILKMITEGEKETDEVKQQELWKKAFDTYEKEA